MEPQGWLEPGERLGRYLASFRKALEEAEKNLSGGRAEREVLDLARRYYKDASYSYEKGDHVTGLVEISYAEGLLDALRLLGSTSFEWRRVEEPRVFVGGTFDIIHPGHVAFLREASRYGRLYVAVARNSNVRRFKGRDPFNDEEHRLAMVSSIRYVYEAFLGDESDYLKSVERVRPGYIVLGPDQFADPETLSRELEARGLGGIRILRLSEKVGGFSSSAVVKKILESMCRC